MAGLTRRIEQQPQVQPAAASSDTLSREWCLALIDLCDRSQRLAAAFREADVPQASSWWPQSRRISAAWQRLWATQRDAFEIFSGHLENALRRAGLSRISTAGARFDPDNMVAVGTMSDAAKPEHSVAAEVLPGYSRGGVVIRPAQVKVIRNSFSSS
jgi:hypothetical protein